MNLRQIIRTVFRNTDEDDARESGSGVVGWVAGGPLPPPIGPANS